MSARAVIDAVADRLAGTSGVFNVHRFIRWIEQLENIDALAFHAPSQRYTCWMITRSSLTFASSDAERPNTVRYPQHEIMIEGWYGVEDASQSERIWQDIIDSVTMRFLPIDEPWLKLTPAIAVLSTPVVEVIDHAELSNIICHHARIRLSIADGFDGSNERCMF